jgi:hypothetical protein
MHQGELLYYIVFLVLAIISQTMKQQFAVISEKMVHPGG